MDFERFPGLVDAFHHGHHPTEEGWRESLLKMEQVIMKLEAEIAELDGKMSSEPSKASELAHERKDLERRLQQARTKRELIEGAIKARLFSDPLAASAGEASTIRPAAGGAVVMTSTKETPKPLKLLFLDPETVTVSPGNARCATPFDLQRNAPLIDSIGQRGQLTPVPVRKLEDGTYQVLAGTRRLGAVRLLAKEKPGLKLQAHLVEANDRQAWRIAYSENEDRKGITAFQTARAWSYAVEHFCDGSQEKLANQIGKDKTTVSHTLALLHIPDEVRFALKDPEAISVSFGSKLLQALRSDRRDAMIKKAAEIASSDSKCSPAELLRVLLKVGGEGDVSNLVQLDSEPGQAVLSNGPKGSHVLTFKPVPADWNQERRRDLLRRIETELEALFEITPDAPIAA